MTSMLDSTLVTLLLPSTCGTHSAPNPAGPPRRRHRNPNRTDAQMPGTARVRKHPRRRPVRRSCARHRCCDRHRGSASGTHGDHWWRSLQERGPIRACDDERADAVALKNLDDSVVDLFVVPVTQQHEVVDVRRPFGPRDHVVRLAPSRPSLAAGNDATPIPDLEHTALPVTGGVRDLAEI